MKKFLKSAAIEEVYPELNGGLFAVKREIGDKFEVWADIIKEGHSLPLPYLKYKFYKDEKWTVIPMEHFDNDRWTASFPLEKVGFYEYTIEAVAPEDKSLVTEYKILKVKVDPEIARYAAWYEMWPRSQGTDPTRSATFKECEKRLPEIADLGFDVLYLTPIHPIGKTNRKGPNNSVKAEKDSPGCPYAVGSDDGGHRAVEPGLGTLDDFDSFVSKAKEYGMEIALDIAHTVSPDHPYVRKHPDWFYKRADGSIKCAENPPKVYEDIYPFNFYCEDQMGLWEEMRDVFFFWIERGVKIFRIDNPHTKPFDFWQWVINEIQVKYPETIFLSEAFTKPKVMKYLSKAGFTQSYTYFTWRNYKQELIDYFYELTNTEVAEYMRGNLFTNTPDILPFIIQQAGKPAFKMRLVLAATLSSVYGMYNGYELCENAAIPGKEEYLNSEKYEFKVWDWDREGNIKPFVKKINTIRKENPALHLYKNLRFYNVNNDNIMFYSKISPNRDNIIFVAVNVNPFISTDTVLNFPLNELGIGWDEQFLVEELIRDKTFYWTGANHHWAFNPDYELAAIFRIKKIN